MLREEDINTLINRAIEKRDKHRREGHDETGEWWDGYRTALQLVLCDRMPESLKAEIESCKGCSGRRWLMPLSPEECGVPCPLCNKDGKREVYE